MKRLRRNLCQISLFLLLLLLPLNIHWMLSQPRYPEIYEEFSGVALHPFELALVVLLVASAGLKRRRRHEGQVPILAYSLSLLALVTLASALWAQDPFLTVQLGGSFVVLLATVAAVWRLNPSTWLVRGSLALLMAVQSAAAVLQFYLQDDLGLRWLGEPDLNRYPGGGSVLFDGVSYWIRSYGLTPHPNILGGVLAVCILALAAALLMAPARQRPFWLVLLLGGAAGLFVSFSRSAWLGTLGGGLYFAAVLLWHKQWRQTMARPLALLSVSAALLLAVLAWQHQDLLRARTNPTIDSLESRSVAERTYLNEAALRLIAEAPLTGTGAMNSTPALLPQIRSEPDVSPQPIHNLLLLTTAELGLAGGAIWLWLMLMPPVFALIRLRQGRLTIWALALISALVAFSVIDLFDYYAWAWPHGRALRWILWGLWGAAVSGVETGYESTES